MLKVDTFEYVSMLKELVEEGKEVGLTVSGNSMSPFLINDRDYVYIKAPEKSLRVGDIVLFQRADGQFILHRICSIKDGAYYIIGDAQNKAEGPIAREQIFAVVTKVHRKGKVIEPGDFIWTFFSKVWPRVIPLRPQIIRLYQSTRK